mgnify:CR=1 FL=1
MHNDRIKVHFSYLRISFNNLRAKHQQFGDGLFVQRRFTSGAVQDRKGLGFFDHFTGGGRRQGKHPKGHVFQDFDHDAAQAVHDYRPELVVVFGANDNLSRGEVAIILQRAYGLTNTGTSSKFTDVSSRYKDAVNALVDNNITDGISSTKFGVTSNITRGQLAVFMYRLSEN